jgi:hypothetical protein
VSVRFSTRARATSASPSPPSLQLLKDREVREGWWRRDRDRAAAPASRTLDPCRDTVKMCAPRYMPACLQIAWPKHEHIVCLVTLAEQTIVLAAQQDA